MTNKTSFLLKGFDHFKISVRHKRSMEALFSHHTSHAITIRCDDWRKRRRSRQKVVGG